MSKLQLYITKSFHGAATSLLNLNPSADVRQYVKDLSSLLEKVKYDAAEKNIFYLLSSTDDGIFVTVIRTIPSNPIDHLAAWIYLPTEVIVTGAELEKIVKDITRIVSGHGVSADGVGEMRALFTAEYPVDPERPAYTAGAPNGGWAWRAYGGEYAPKFSEFMGEGRFQLGYLPYEGVLLVDSELDYNVSLPDLSDMPLGKPAVILPPKPTREEFVAHAFDKVLDKPIAGTVGAELTIEWRRPGFEPVIDTVTVDKDMYTPAPVLTNESRKLITRDSFSVTSRTDHSRLTDCEIHVNGTIIDNHGALFTEGELKEAEVSVSRDGFVPFKAHINLASSTRALVQLKERLKTYCFELPVNSSDLGGPVKFKIYSKNPLDDSPIEGYELLDDIQEGETRTNHLGYVRPRLGAPSKAALFVAGGFVLGLLCGVLFNCSGDKPGSTLAPGAQPEADTTSVIVPAGHTVEKSAKPVTPAAAPASTSAATIDAAVKYLDENRTWNKTEMEKYPALAGLFDDMNNLRLQRLADEWAPKLEKSEQFKEVAFHAQESLRKKRSLRATYNEKAGDLDISVVGYQNYIDK